MKTQRSSSKSGLFLIELIIAIVFFAVASAICIQLFVQAHLISNRSRDLSVATAIAQNQAELFKSGGIDLPDDDQWVDPLRQEAFFDVTGALTASGEAFYRLDSTYSAPGQPGGLFIAELAVYRASGSPEELQEPICTLEVKSYDETTAR